MKKILLILSVFLSVISKSQTVYHISPTGNDITGNGTISTPWATLFKATSTVTTSGDFIHVYAGSYTETQQSNLRVGVSIEGDGRATTTIKSTESRDFEPIIVCNSAEGTNGNQSISKLTFDGDNLNTDWGVSMNGRSNFNIYDCAFYDFADRGVIMEGRGYDTPPAIYATGNTFHDNIMDNCAGYDLPTGTYGRGCLNIGGQDGMLIYNNTITQDSRPEGFNGWPIKYNNNGYLKGVKIYNNILNKIPLGSTNGGTGWDFAIEFFNESGLEIYNNIINGGGIDANHQTLSLGGTTYPYSVYIHNNLIQNTTPNPFRQAAITLEYGTDGAICENNTIINQSIAFYFTPRTADSVQNILLRKNLCVLVIGEGGGSFIDFGGDPVTGDLQYNLHNTVVHNTFVYKSTLDAPFGVILPRALTGKVEYLNMSDNIFSNAGFFWLTQPSVSTAVIPDHITINNNCIYSNGSSNGINWAGGGSGTNYSNSANINSDPQWTNPSAGDYTLQSGSPAKNTAGDGSDMGYTGGSDTTAPVVLITTPIDGATGVSTASTVSIIFSETMNASTLISSNIYIVGKSGSITTGSNSAIITTDTDFSPSTTYTVMIENVEDFAGNIIMTPYTFSFTTGSVPRSGIKLKGRWITR